jgi:hypothetical protein
MVLSKTEKERPSFVALGPRDPRGRLSLDIAIGYAAIASQVMAA